jgi:hypothetical protein
MALLTRQGEMQYKQLYEGLKIENEKLRAENGDLLCGLHAHADTLRADNERLKSRLDRTQQELERQRQLLDGATAAAEMRRGAEAEAVPAAGASSKVLEGVSDEQNLFELRIERAELNVGADVGTFVTVDFYDHLTQVQRFGTSAVQADMENVAIVVGCMHGHPIFCSMCAGLMVSTYAGEHTAIWAKASLQLDTAIHCSNGQLLLPVSGCNCTAFGSEPGLWL